MLRCIWNGWPTARRKQQRVSACLLVCGRGEDAVSHYARCAHVRAVGRQHLGLGFRFSDPLAHWCMTAPDCADIERDSHWWPKVAVLMYATMRATNSARVQGMLPMADALRALRQGVVEGVRGHPVARFAGVREE